jgi:hypothetical protein
MLHANTYQPDSITSKQPSPTGLRTCVGVPCEACSVRTQCALDEVLHSRLLQLRVSKISVNCIGFTWAGGQGQQQPNKSFSANGWHEFSMSFIATDVTLIHSLTDSRLLLGNQGCGVASLVLITIAAVACVLFVGRTLCSGHPRQDCRGDALSRHGRLHPVRPEGQALQPPGP